jgi:hypothetical protein
MGRPIEHEEAEPVGAVSKRGDGASGVPMNSAEISGDAAKPGGYALGLRRARAVRSGAASAADPPQGGEVSSDEGLGFPIKTQEAGEVPATFSFRFTEDALYVTGTAPIGEDQALIIADVLGECFGAQMLEAAAAFAVEQEAGKPPQHRLRLVVTLRDDAEPSS